MHLHVTNSNSHVFRLAYNKILPQVEISMAAATTIYDSVLHMYASCCAYELTDYSIKLHLLDMHVNLKEGNVSF